MNKPKSTPIQPQHVISDELYHAVEETLGNAGDFLITNDLLISDLNILFTHWMQTKFRHRPTDQDIVRRYVGLLEFLYQLQGDINNLGYHWSEHQEGEPTNE